MYSIKCKVLTMLFVTFMFACGEEENQFSSTSCLELQAEPYNFCQEHSFSFDTLIVDVLYMVKDSLKETLSTMMLGPRLSSTFLFTQDSFKFVIYAQFSEKFDSLQILKTVKGQFVEEVDFNDFASACIPRKRGTLYFDLSDTSAPFASSIEYDMNCISESFVLRYEELDAEFTMIAKRYETR